MIANALAQPRLVCMSSVPADANVSSDSCSALHLSICAGGLTLDSRLCSWFLASEQNFVMGGFMHVCRAAEPDVRRDAGGVCQRDHHRVWQVVLCA